MFLTAKRAAFAGITLAVSFLLMMLGSVWEASTLFFLAAAAFCIGIVIREFGLKAGAAFLAASVLLTFFLAPNKLYVLTYGMMETYILLRELLWELVFAKREKKERQQAEGTEWERPGVKSSGTVKRLRLHYGIGKWILFQPLFLPVIFLAPQLLYTGELSLPVWGFLILGGQILWFVADLAYDVFQTRIWTKLRRRMNPGS